MKRTIMIAALAAGLAGTTALTTGCQNAHKTDNTGRPMKTSATYDRAYVTVRATEWVAQPDAVGAERQTIPAGTRVMLADEPMTTATYQPAMVNGRLVYVRPADLAKETR